MVSYQKMDVRHFWQSTLCHIPNQIERYWFPVDLNNPGELNLTRISHEQFKPGKGIGWFQRPNYLVGVVLKGRGVFLDNESKTDITKGTAFSFAPHTEHAVLSSKSEPLTIYRVVFVGKRASELLVKFTGSLCHAWHLSDQTECTILIRRMFSLLKQHAYYAEESCVHYLYLLLHALCRASESSSLHNSSVGIARIAKHIIDSEFATDITILQIGEKIGVRYEHLVREFKKQQGISPGVYLRRMRMNKAADLLGDGLKVSYVATAVGYKDIAPFSKAFKREFGVSPSRFTER